MNMRRLRWLTVVMPLFFLALIDAARHLIWPQLLHPWPGYLIVLGLVTVGIYAFSKTVFDRIEAIERRLVEQNRALREASATMQRQTRQLQALHEAGLALASNLNLEVVLQRVVDQATALTDARYGALAVLDENSDIVRFITSGISPEERARLGEPPKGRGLLGAVLREGRPIRIDDISRDPRSVGFPAGHPPMTTFLGVPISYRGRTIGNLYLTDKQGANESIGFNAEDEDLLRLFAAEAAVAIENARLHAEVQSLAVAAERGRIARELHDSLAQVLGYVRLRAAAGHDALRDGDVAAAQDALREIGAAADDAYADVREAILGLRSQVGAERDFVDALDEYFQRYRLQTGMVVEFQVEDAARDARLALGAEAQLLRIIQEALTNVRKHARASKATVRLELAGDTERACLRATVRDDGQGFDTTRVPAGARFGLTTMRERAEATGGQLRIDSAPGQGTTITAEMPLESITRGQATSPGRG